MLTMDPSLDLKIAEVKKVEGVGSGALVAPVLNLRLILASPVLYIKGYCSWLLWLKRLKALPGLLGYCHVIPQALPPSLFRATTPSTLSTAKLYSRAAAKV